MKSSQVARLLAYVTGLLNQELLLQVEYLVAENRILRAHAPGRLRLSNEQRSTLAEIGNRLGRKGLAKVALIAKPETILSWFRKLVAQKFDGSNCRSYPGRTRIDAEVEALIVQMARENSGWVMTGSPVHLPISATRSLTRRSGTFCASMGSRRLRNAARGLPRRTSSLRFDTVF